MSALQPLSAMSLSAPNPIEMSYTDSEFAPEPNPLSTGCKLSAADLKSQGTLRLVSFSDFPVEAYIMMFS